MSDAVMQELVNIADSMTQDELRSAVSIFRDRLKKTFGKQNRKKRLTKQEKAAQKLWQLANTLHLCSDGTKWTREELYER